MSSEHKKNEVRLKRVIEGLRYTGDALGIHPSEVTTGQFKTQSVTEEFIKKIGNVTHWDIRMVGGLSAIKKHHFPIVGKDLVEIRRQKETNSYISELERLVGQSDLRIQQVREEIRKQIEPVKVKPYKVISKKRKKIPRHIVIMLNDTHYGLNVDEDEVGGVNKLNWNILSRRTAMVIEKACQFKLSKRDETEKVHLILNGDIIAGLIHNQKSQDAELLVHQMAGAIHILTHAISRLVENFPQVEVHFISGNHGDAIHRRNSPGSRVTAQIYDSYEGEIFYSLSVAFREYKNVKFKTTKTIYGSIDLPGGRVVYTHGHLLFSSELGNPGRNIKTESITDAVLRFNNGEKKKGNKAAGLFLVGHTHVQFSFTTEDGVVFYNAPSMSGIDSFAYSLGINHNNVGQLIFESVPGHILGDNRIIKVDKADENSKYDKIIPSYKRTLTWDE